MRTTLDIAEDVLQAVEEKARRQQRSPGDLLSELVREALSQRRDREELERKRPESFYGFHPLPSRGVVVSNELIDDLREEGLD